MVAEQENKGSEEEPFPEPTPEERSLPLGKRGELAAARFLQRKGYGSWKRTGYAMPAKQTSSPRKTIRCALSR